MYGLNEETLIAIKKVFSEFKEIEKAVIYGSRAKGNYRNGSDIDITLFGNNLSLDSLLKLDEKLDDLYLPYTMDISIFSQIDNNDLIDHINRVGKEFYSKWD